MPSVTELGIVLVYPELLGTYGDQGNALALVHRARGRGIAARVVQVRLGDPLPRSGDVYLLGGSEDAAQVLALQSLLDQEDRLDVLAESACLAVCAGFQLVARSFTGPDGRTVPGLGLLDVTCGRLPGPRAVGEVVAEATGLPGLPTLTGYENHQGDAVLGPGAVPLGLVVSGTGNGHDRAEGAVAAPGGGGSGDTGRPGGPDGTVVGTYLHGPVLVRNPALADHLLERSTGPLPPYEDALVDRLRSERLEAAARGRG